MASMSKQWVIPELNYVKLKVFESYTQAHMTFLVSEKTAFLKVMNLRGSQKAC